MLKNHQDTLIRALEAEIKKARKTAEKSRATAKEFRRASRSQQGDRRLYETAADLAESKLEELIVFKKTLENIPIKKNQRVEPFSFVKVEYDNGTVSPFHFVPQRIHLQDKLLVTPESPLGQAVIGKKEGEKFTFKIKRDGRTATNSGKIVKVE